MCAVSDSRNGRYHAILPVLIFAICAASCGGGNPENIAATVTSDELVASISDDGLSQCVRNALNKINSKKIESIETLDCSFGDGQTPIVSLEDAHRIPGLRILNVTDNAVSTIEDVNLEMLDELILDGNPLSVESIQLLFESDIPRYSVNIVDKPYSSNSYRAGGELIVTLLSAINDSRFAVEYSLDQGATWVEISTLDFSTGAASWVAHFRSLPEVVDLKVMSIPSNLDVGRFSVDLQDFDREICERYEWTSIAEQAAYAARDGAELVTYNGLLWMLGGWNPDESVFPGRTTNEVWLTSDGLDWQKIKENSFINKGSFDSKVDWEGRHWFGAVVYDGSMWIVGGDPLQGYYQNDIWRSENGVNWRRLLANPPWGNRALENTVVFDDYIWVLGGQTLPQLIPGEPVFYSDIWKSRDGQNWEKVDSDNEKWSARGIGGAVAFDGKIWILGGGRYNTPVTSRAYYSDVWVSQDGAAWERILSEAPWEPRIYHNVVSFDGRLWVLAGSTNKSLDLNDVWTSIDGEYWTQCPSPFPPRHAAALTVRGNALFITGGAGYDPSELPFEHFLRNDVWRLTVR